MLPLTLSRHLQQRPRPHGWLLIVDSGISLRLEDNLAFLSFLFACVSLIRVCGEQTHSSVVQSRIEELSPAYEVFHLSFFLSFCKVFLKPQWKVLKVKSALVER